jgi:hypothetical protein
MRHMPAAMVHGGGGVLLMMMTKLASQQTIKNTELQNQMRSKPPPTQPHPTQNKKTKSQA